VGQPSNAAGVGQLVKESQRELAAPLEARKSVTVTGGEMIAA
jgi:hypothetical protein